MAGRISREEIRAATLLLPTRLPPPATRPLPVVRRPAILIGPRCADGLNHPQRPPPPTAPTTVLRLKPQSEERTRIVRIWLTASRHLRMSFNRRSSLEFLPGCN